MPKRTRPYRDSLLEDLQDPLEAAAYLNAAIEDSEEMFLIALRDVAEAHQMSKVAAEAGVARETMYRMLSRSGNPRYANLSGVLKAIGVRMSFAPAVTPIDATPGRPGTTSRNAIGNLGGVGLQCGAKNKGPLSELASVNGMPGHNAGAMYSQQLAGV